MKTLPLIIVLLFLSACTTTSVKRFTPEGEPAFEASNTSIGWDRENVTLDLLKSKDDTALKIGIGKSGGSQGLEKAIKMMEEGLAIMKGAASPGL
jgi:hypothetical protein